MSSVCSTSCLVSVAIVPRPDAMKSARRPGSVMLEASACRSSDISGDSDTICWKFVLMLRCSASISRRSPSFSTSGASLILARKYGRLAVTSSRRTRARPCTMMRRLPSGSLNILWIWLAVPIACRSFCVGSSSPASRCANTAMVWPLATASSMSFTELSRATASGMKACGNSTVSRNGNTGISAGTRNDGVSAPPDSNCSNGLLTMTPLLRGSRYSRWHSVVRLAGGGTHRPRRRRSLCF